MCSADVPKGCDRNGGGISVAAAGLTDAEPRGQQGVTPLLGGALAPLQKPLVW